MLALLRALAVLTAASGLLACPAPDILRPIPQGRFYFPTALVHRDVPGNPEGVLYVATGDFDKRYGGGSVVAVDLSRVGLAPLGREDGGLAPRQLVDLGQQDWARAEVRINAFAGELAAFPTGDGGLRLVAPTRSEGMWVAVIEAPPPQGPPRLLCYLADGGPQGQDCRRTGVTMTPAEVELSATGLPRAPAPYGVAVRARTCAADADCGGGAVQCQAGRCLAMGTGEVLGEALITHLTPADSPTGSTMNQRSYLARLDLQAPVFDAARFVELGFNPGSSVAILGSWALVSGRAQSGGEISVLRLVGPTGRVVSAALEQEVRLNDSRGVAVSQDGSRVYLVGRGPDSLLVLAVRQGAEGPSLSAVRTVRLPEAAAAMQVVPRPGRGDLVLVSTLNAGALVLYDDDVGDLVAQVSGVGLQPLGVAVDVQGPGARAYVAGFGDGRVAVVDIPDLGRPQEARVVAHLGALQLCLQRPDVAGCAP